MRVPAYYIALALVGCARPVTHDAPPVPAPPPAQAMHAPAPTVIVDASVDAGVDAIVPPDAVPPLEPKYGEWWLPRRPLPKHPTLPDVLCAGANGDLFLDAVPDPDGPTAVAIDATTMRVCAHGSCRDVSPVSIDEPYGGTDGTYLVSGTPSRVYRVADAAPLYTLDNAYVPDDAAEFACGGITGFFGHTLLALGHDCSGPIALPWLLDARSGKRIARINFRGEKFVMDGFLRAMHLDGDRWVVIQVNRDEVQCFAMILDARTGAVAEHLECTPKPARRVGKRLVPFTPISVPRRPPARLRLISRAPCETASRGDEVGSRQTRRRDDYTHARLTDRCTLDQLGAPLREAGFTVAQHGRDIAITVDDGAPIICDDA